MKPTLVVIDFSVLVFQMEYALSPLTESPMFTEMPLNEQDALLTSLIYGQLYYVGSLDFMGDDRPEEYRIVYVMDTKARGKYWRHDYLLSTQSIADRQTRMDAKPRKQTAEGIKYKSGRKVHSALNSLIRREMKRIVQAEPSWDLLTFPLYEADDIAGALVKMCDGDRYIWLLTIDTDWMGLISDSVGWFCLYGYNPRVRNSIETFNIWATSRLKTTFDKPQDIYAYKALHGDRSDGLPVLSPIEVIDLLNPPSDYCLWDIPETRKALQEVLDHDEPSVDLSAGIATYIDRCREIGVMQVVKNT